jgi:hypothetical protein
VRCDQIVQRVAIQAGKSRGWGAFVTREETTCRLQANGSRRLAGDRGCE